MSGGSKEDFNRECVFMASSMPPKRKNQGWFQKKGTEEESFVEDSSEEEVPLKRQEPTQKEHDLQIQGANSQFTDTLAAKDEEIRRLHETIEEKEACIMRMSENLTSEQSDFAKARQQHNDDALQLSEMEKKYFVAKQQVHALSQNELNLRDSLNQELETSAQLKREASVMEGNFRRIETENERLQKLTNEQELDIRRIEGMLSEWSQKLTDSKSSTDSLQRLVLNAIKAERGPAPRLHLL
jgi:hypothetical protein